MESVLRENARRTLLNEFGHCLAQEIEELETNFQANDNGGEDKLYDEGVENSGPSNLTNEPESIISVLVVRSYLLDAGVSILFE